MVSQKAATASLASNSSGVRTALTPLKKPKPGKPFSVGDIESMNWTKFLVIGHYDGTDIHHFFTLSEFLDHVFNHPHDTIFFHFGGIFDFLFVLGEVFQSKKYFLESLIPRGSSLLSVTLTDGRRSISLRDSSALLPFALRTLAANFGCVTQKGEIEYDKITGVTPDLLRYLDSDLLALHEVLSRFYSSEIIRSAGPKVTIASQSLQVLRKYLKDPIPSCPGIVDSFVRRSYAGGRTEIFRPFFQSVEGVPERGELSNYDINSLYPYVMRENAFPTQFKEWTKELDLEGMGFHEVYVDVPEGMYLPVLWKKSPKFIFPTGRFWGVFSTPELRFAIDRGARVVRHRKSAMFNSGGFLFREFVTDLYERRKNSESEVDRTIIKLILNSTYGRMGLNLERETLELDQGQPDVIPDFEFNAGNERIRFVRRSTFLKTFSNPAIASYVTSYARLENYKYLERFRDSIHYTDTDSFFTRERHPISKELGELKLEYTMNEACFLLPKTYIAGGKVAMKGFDKKKIGKFKFEDFQNALEGEFKLKIDVDPKMARLKTAMRKGEILHLMKKSTKEIRSRYDKRILYRDDTGQWNSRPHHILESEISPKGI